jgi:putative two-component system response regulator
MKDILISDKADVVVVDDQPENLKLLVGLLAPHFTVHPFMRGGDLYRYLEAGHPADLVLLDVVMPAPDGLEICRVLRQNPDLLDVPIVFLTSLDSCADEEIGLSTGAVDYITKPFSPPIVLARVAHHVRLGRALRTIQNLNDFLDERVEERTAELVRKNSELMRTQEATIHALSVLVETRDSDTGHHIHRTQHYLRELAQAARQHADFALQLDDAMITELFRSAPLHDIGKVAIPDRVLLKPGRLDPDEFNLMKTHTTHGRDAIARAEQILGSSDSFLHHARDIAYSHHERWDGGGYPQGLSGEDIPLSARLMAIADVYDALISSRSYKTGMSHDKAVAIIREGHGTQFDPRVVDIFLDIHNRFDEIAGQFADAETAALTLVV